MPVFGLMGNLQNSSGSSASTQYDARISGLEEKLDELLLQFTEKHPEVVGIRETITLLENKREQELADIAATAAMNPDTDSSLSENPVYQEMKIALGEAEGCA